MRHKVRVTESKYNGYNGGNRYRHMYIQFFEEQNRCVDVIGTIQYQTDEAHEARVLSGESERRWYGFKAEVTDDKPVKFFKMGKLVEYIRKNSYWDSQPEQILAMLDAEVYVVCKSEWVKASEIGQNLYKVYRSDIDRYDGWFVAVNDILAKKEFNKYCKARKIDASYYHYAWSHIITGEDTYNG